MADYHSLLMRAVANLPNAGAAATRRAIYDRARQALLTQLRTLRPPLPESDIAREESALDAAIAQIESGLGSREATPTSAPPTQAARTPGPPAGNGAPVAPPPKPAAAGAPSQPTVIQRSPAPATPQSQPAPGAPAASAAPQRFPSQPAPQSPPRPSPSAPVQSGAPQRPPAAAPARSQPAPSAAGQFPPAPIPPAGRPAAVAPPPARPAPVPAVIKPPQPAIGSKDGSAAAPMVGVKDAKDESSPATALDPTKAVRSTKADDAHASAAPPVVVTRPDEPLQSAGAPEVQSEIDRPGSAARPDLEGQRPIAPGVDASTPKTWLWIAAAVVFGVVVAVAGAAILMRQKPQDLAIKPPAEAQAPAQPQSQAKIAERVEPPAPATPASPPAPTSEPKEDQTGGQGAGAPASPAGAAQNPPAAPAPTAGRAAMLVASADNPQKPVVSLGSTVWSLIPAVPGQPATIAVKADADIPDLKMHATMTLRKNTDPTLQATHTIDLKFSFADGAPITGFKDVGLPQMRKEDSTAAEALTSVKVKISDIYFLIALAKGDSDTARNLDLMQTRAWFDFPLLLNDNRIAKIVFQKSLEGEAMLGKAFDAWK